ncbi:mechanosensitive ion channel family protein [Actibacterium pelagium]|uniref:Mechanosensitive ion channel n=1 Tax=Actibacterium pelagium TaxID=2029103 RepID=A0A917EKT0_9RHOB|nr:mechanosensitive ion channel domain-containing protein [Actibacterium pelagium]GGE56270.1 hypothetical protein GCM10011517_24910 [Actibacterium pelagium]
MENQPEIIQKALGFAEQGKEIALEWLTSPAAWSQFGLLVVAFIAALLLTRRASPIISKWLTPPEEQTHFIARSRRFLLQFLPLLMPLLAYVFTGIGEGIVRSIFETGAVIAFGKRVFMFLAVRILVKDILNDGFLKLLGRYVALPLAAVYAVGLMEPLIAYLNSLKFTLGNITISLMALIRGAVAGGILFWLGRWSNDQSASYLKSQDQMRPATRELAIKASEIAIFGVAFLLLMNIMGINLSTLAVLGGAIGVGLGFGLQKIASNFISGIILLLEGQATVGDYVELDGGEAGTIVKMTSRATILETFDGRWIVVPNEDFITTRVVNYSDAGSANRYEAPFSVSYDTDINKLPEIIETAVGKLDFVLQEPDGPDCELRGFGDSGIDFAVEFWVEGIDDGQNKFTPKVLFAIWNALKENNIEIPYPHRVVEFKGTPPQATS